MSDSLTSTEHQAVQAEERLLSEVLLDTCWKSLERATNHFEKLDVKASSLGGFVGVMLTVLLTVSPNIFGAGFQTGFALLAQILYVVATLLLAVSLYFCTRVLRLRDVKEVPLASEIIKSVQVLPSSPTVDSEFRHKLAALVAEASDDHHFVSANKMASLSYASMALVWAVGTIVAAGLCFTFHMTLKTYEPNEQPVAKQL